MANMMCWRNLLIRPSALILLLVAIGGVAPVLAGESVGARAAALGGASVVLTDPSALWNNPSAIVLQHHCSVTFSQHIPFGIRELSLKTLGVVYPVKKTLVSSGLRYFGYTSYHETELRVSLARTLAAGWSLGVSMGWHRRYVAFASRHPDAVSGSVGVLGMLSPNVSLGLCLLNITGACKDRNHPYRVPSGMRLGGGLRIEPDLFLVAECFKDVEFPPVWMAGLEYTPVSLWVFRAGCSLGSVRRFSAGFGFRYRSFLIDFSFFWHQVLGFTPATSLTWQRP